MKKTVTSLPARGLLLGSALLPLLTGAMAQDDAAPDQQDEATDEIVVVAQGIGNRAQTTIEPEITYTASEIAAFGASTLEELLQVLEAETGSARGGGRPVFLLNGRRIANFWEIRRYPPEAIDRMEILPEEAALAYGFPANQRVVNFILKDRFDALTVESELGAATEGGAERGELELSHLQLRDSRRMSVDASFERTEGITEADRDIIPDTGPDGPDLTSLRTLSAPRQEYGLSGTYFIPMGTIWSTTLSAALEGETSEGTTAPYFAEGTDPAVYDRFDLPLARDSETLTGRLGVTVNGEVADWKLTFTGDHESTDRETEVESAPPLEDLLAASAGLPLGVTRTDSTTRTTDVNALATGQPIDLPAGPVQLSLSTGIIARTIDSASLGPEIDLSTDLSREEYRAQGSLEVPVADGGRGVLPVFGELSLNLNGAVTDYSDAGTLSTYGGGINWSPFEPVTLIASISREETPATISQLGDPLSETPDVRIFDFTTGETVAVTRISGGNPDLLPASSTVSSFSVNFRPFEETNFRLRAEYVDTQTDDPIRGCPAPSAAIEGAFPDRFTRVDGDLVALDVRPINFAEAERQDLVFGMNYSRRLGEMRPPQGGRPGARPEPDGWMWMALTHTTRLSDEVLVAEGGPRLDLLGGDAISSTGGTPEQQTDLRSGLFYKGFGGRFDLQSQSATEVGGEEPLEFSGRQIVDLRFFVDLGRRPGVMEKAPFFKDTRVSLRVDNVFEDRITVRNGEGVTPLNYQPGYLDPEGRTVEIEFRKLFQ